MPKAKIYYHDIGDYLNREEKLAIVSKFKSVVNPQMNWRVLKPNEHGDWISQRNDVFETFIPLGDKKSDQKTNTFFVSLYSNGIKTNRDSWVYNFSKKTLKLNVVQTINFFNEQASEYETEKRKYPNLKVEEFINSDPTKISWSRAFRDDIGKNRRYTYDLNKHRIVMYRPFVQQHSYFSKDIINDLAKLPLLFPKPDLKNQLICIPAPGGNTELSVLISNYIPDLHFNGDTQCFPLYYYEERKVQQRTLFDTNEGEGDYIRRDGISDFILERAKKQYGKNVDKEDIFYYVYGVLHSPEYRNKFANDLKKMLPRLPLVEDVRDFWAFSKAGHKLADLHINYESVPPYDGVVVNGAETLSFIDTEPAGTNLYRVEKMRFPRKDQKDTIIYNSRISIENIPLDAYNYVVNGKSAIEWIMERYQVTTHKESGIKNDPNDWATEVGNPRYILDLLLSIINVSVKTNEIVRGLPRVSFE